MIILPPRRDSGKDTLANYTTGAAVEKNKSQYICGFPLFYTHTPLNWYPCRLPCRTVTSVKIRSLWSFYLYKVQLELILISQTDCTKESLPLPSV